MPGSDIDYEIPSSAGDFGPPPPLRQELVIVPEWKTRNGKATAVYQFELNTGEHGEFTVSDRVFDQAGNVTRIKQISPDVRFLAYTTRTGDGLRYWSTIEAAEAVLKPLGKSITNRLVTVANKVNYGDDASSVEEAAASAEGNSEETPTSA